MNNMFDINIISEQEKKTLTISLISILDSWDISDKDKVTLLALPNDFKTKNLYLFKNGDKVFDYNQNTLNRAEILLGIYDSLGTTYPANRNYGSIWLKRPMKKFDKKTPLELMLSGDIGIKRIWHFLDCTQSWQD